MAAPCSSALAGDLGLDRVHRDHQLRPRARESFHHRHHPPQLLLDRNRLVAPGPGGLAADVHDRRARRDQAIGMLQGRVQPGESPAVAEAVGRDVEDAHDDGAIQRDRPPRGVPDLRLIRGKGEPDLSRGVRQGLGHRPRTGECTETRATAGQKSPGVAGDDLQAQAAGMADQGFQGSLIETGQMNGERR